MVEIYENYEVKKHSTFKIGGKVKKVAFPETIEELISLISTNEYHHVIGNCSNILFSSNDINKKIIFTEKINGYFINGCSVIVSCGTKGPIVASECAKKNLSGFEFLIGFPGSFGGMIYMNASAHNQAIADTFVCANLYNQNNKTIIHLNKEEMHFKYRNSIAQENGYIVLDAQFELKKGETEQIQEIMKRNVEFRKTRQPSLTYPNAGSIFKNPENDSAGRLLDLCELKGTVEGGAMVFQNHANFIVNKDNATSTDVLTLMYKMYSKVREKYRIELIPEIKYIGNERTEEYKLWKIMTENTQKAKK
ncbi:UDP-N-acetylmuramate dehydrogenase [bacterium]|nr:UDP-N-acetylmuramate dehydrogenase [bacterium]